jgi:putative ABC transport system substrate-binding protein
VNRRHLLALLGGASTLRPLMAATQPAKLPLIGFVTVAPLGERQAAFSRGLATEGFADGRNVAIEYHQVAGQYERLPAIMADLIARNPALIVASGPPAARAAQRATSAIPVVFVTGSDPVKEGFVASLARPGGNLTGMAILAGELAVKRLELVLELVPQAKHVALLMNPSNAAEDELVGEMQEAGRRKGLPVEVVKAGSETAIDKAFAKLAEKRPGALVVGNDSFFNIRRRQIVELALQTRVPAIYRSRDFVDAGGLLSYGIDIAAVFDQVARYAAKVLNGAKPADLPVQEPSKFELVLNLKTAKALDLPVPQSILARADEVIE